MPPPLKTGLKTMATRQIVEQLGKQSSFSVWNQSVIFLLYVIHGEGETDYGDKLDYILHSYTAIVYLSLSKTYNMISCDNYGLNGKVWDRQ